MPDRYGVVTAVDASLITTFIGPLASEAQVVDVPGAGHWLAEEAPECVAERILGFVDTTG